MKVVVDTNIIFSSILNSSGLIGDVLFNTDKQIDFYSPEFMIRELSKYKSKLQEVTKMTSHDIDTSIYHVLKNIKLISPEAISELSWKRAFELTKGIDENDTPFIATAISINSALWTGDKKLSAGLKNKGYKDIYSTSELYKLIR